MTTGILNGTALILYVNDVAIAYSTSHSLSMSMATREITNKSSAGWKDVLEGLREWSIDGENLFAFDASYGFDDLFGLINNRTKVTVKFSTEASGDKFYSGSAYLTSLSKEAPTEGNTTYSYTFEGAGVLTESTQT